MQNNEAIELLNSIQKVDPPPFLLTRIEARLEQALPAPRSWVLTSVLALCAIIAVNVVLLSGQASAGRENVAALAEGMGLDNSNQLYR